MEDWTPNNKRAETPAERADRNFMELLSEFRVAQQGVQVLFAFLLTVPFTARFQSLSSLQEWSYFLALLSAAFGTILFVAPVSHHRMLFRRGLKDQIVNVAGRYAQAGIVALLVSMLSSVFLVTSVVIDYTMAYILVALGVLSAVVLWYAFPIHYRRLSHKAKTLAETCE